jgi:hypothetical protein
MFDYTEEIWEPEVHTEIDNDAEADNAEDEARAAEAAEAPSVGWVVDGKPRKASDPA